MDASLLGELERLTPDDLARSVPLGYATVPVQIAIQIFAFESGVHGNDLAWALGEERALPSDVIEATALFLMAAFPLFAAAATVRPPSDLGYVVRGSAAEFRLAYSGAGWELGGTLPTRVCTITGDDSAVLLFALGRIPAGHPSLNVAGERAAASQFKTYFPGP